MTTNSSHLASKNEKDFLELVWENGQILGAKVTSSNRTTTTTQNKPLCIGYSTNHSNNNEDVIINNTKKRRTNSNSSLLNHFSAQNLSSSHIDFQSSQSKPFHNPNEKFQQTHLFSYSTPLKKPRLDYSNSKKQNLGCDQRTGIVNFSNFSIPAMFLKSNNHQNSTRINVSKEVVIESAKDSSQHGVRKFQHQKTLILTAANKLSNLDEHSETAASHKSTLDDQYNNKQIQKSEALKGKRKARGNEQPSSVCSLEASNDPNFSFRRHDEDSVDTNDSPYLSADDEETPENMIKEKLAREGKRSFKNSEIHNSSERKRRDKINKKIRTLKELIPNCHKTDKASMLDDAIEYLKTLQLQLQIMSMGRGICMPMNQHMNMNMNAQHLIGFMPPQVQFPIPQQMSGSGNCVTDNINNIVQMFGFSNQLPPPLPMSIPNAPFIPIIGNSNSTTTNSTFGNQNQLADRTRGSF